MHDKKKIKIKTYESHMWCTTMKLWEEDTISRGFGGGCQPLVLSGIGQNVHNCLNSNYN